MEKFLAEFQKEFWRSPWLSFLKNPKHGAGGGSVLMRLTEGSSVSLEIFGGTPNFISKKVNYGVSVRYP